MLPFNCEANLISIYWIEHIWSICRGDMNSIQLG